MVNFIALYHGVLFERIQNALGCLLMLFGYIPDKGFLSLRGIVTMAAFVMLAIYGYVTVKHGKMQNRSGLRSLVTLFVKVSFVLNLFVFIFTTSTMVPRYYITIFIFVLSVLCFYLEEEKLPFDRFAVVTLLTICLILGTGKTVMSFLTVDRTKRSVLWHSSLRKTGMILVLLLIIMPTLSRNLRTEQWRSAISEIPSIWSISSGLLP